MLRKALLVCVGLWWSLPSLATVWNNPYGQQETELAADGVVTLYASFEERPKHLDPARSYSSDEWVFSNQIYEAPLQYHYLKRPYELSTALAREMPEVTLLNSRMQPVQPGEEVAFSRYRVRIQEGVMFQPHPAFRQPMPKQLSAADFLSADPSQSRPLKAEDFVYQIKRLAHPALSSPIYGLMSEYIVGLSELHEALNAAWQDQGREGWLDLRRFDLKGVRATAENEYEILLKGRYPQFIYWLAMQFFAPMPWEADQLYAQPGMKPGMKQGNFSLDWYPLGTGPYRLVENNPNRRMVLERNPLFRGEPYPQEGMPGDAPLLADAGQRMPFIDRAVYSLEKETVPRWNKFLQGWYDQSTISSDSFDQAVSIDLGGEATVTSAMAKQGIELKTEVASSSLYLGFNWLDPLVGGSGTPEQKDRARKLRQAISIAVDYEEFIAIFRNGRGVAAQGPIPPGIFGYREGEQGINPMAYRWSQGERVRRGLAEARALLKAAGYAGGRDPATGKPLLLALDLPARGGADNKAMLDWWRKQLAKLGLQLVVRDTDYNRFRTKMNEGKAQMFLWGWNADYPDPENFLFLLYGPNGKVAHGGENAANYQNDEFDRLFERMMILPNGAQRQQVLDRMIRILREDAPWLWGYHPVEFTLHHGWLHNVKPNLMSRNTLKYQRIDPVQRARARQDWNQPVWWPLWLLPLLLALFLVPAWLGLRRRDARHVSVPEVETARAGR